MEKIRMRGYWIPTEQEIESLRRYPKPDSKGRPVLFLPGRDPCVSIILAGRGGMDELSPGTRYFISIRSSVLGNPRKDPRKEGRVRRDVWVRYWEEHNCEDNEFSLEYLTRPITVLEAWRATRGFVSLTRTYEDGRQDTVSRAEPSCPSSGFRVSFAGEEPSFQLEEGIVYPATELQAGVDQNDWFTPDVKRPDWRIG